MATDPQIKQQWQQTAYYEEYSGRSNSGQPSYAGSPTSLTCKVERDFRRVVGANGGVESAQVLIVLTDTAIKRGSRFWLPGVDQTDVKLAKYIKTTSPFEDEWGNNSHYEMELGDTP